MSMTTRSRRSVLSAVVAMALLLAAAPAGAVPWRWDLGGWIRGVLSSLWADNGCSADPSGLCGAAPAPAEMLAAPNGCNIDGNGHCGTAPAPFENGCSFDPSGSCKQ